MKTTEDRIQELINDWITNPRWKGVERPYTAAEVVTLQGSYKIEHSIAKMGAEKKYGQKKSEGEALGFSNLKNSKKKFLKKFEILFRI